MESLPGSRFTATSAPIRPAKIQAALRATELAGKAGAERTDLGMAAEPAA